ncbi:3-phosphoserine/phosphohydroxythreonine transaminase [Piscirickettsia salmonis]
MVENKVYNFSAGPAALPGDVEISLQQAMVNYNGTGVSIGSIGHRTALFAEIAEQSEALLRRLLGVSDDYAVLFLHGGASHQFAMVPMNLLRGKKAADYFVTGTWSKKAYKEAQRYCQANIVGDIQHSADGLMSLPKQQDWRLDPQAAYVYYTPNETIHGLEFHRLPEVGEVPLVADATSTLLSRPLDVNRHGLIFAGAQKNLGIAGVTVVIVRRDLLGHELLHTPTLYSYLHHDQERSLSNTGPIVPWYATYLVLQWIEQQGGVDVLAQVNQRKAQKLYDFIDQSDFYLNVVAKADRSWMNIPFLLSDAELESQFLHAADEQGLKFLHGHHSVGGMRASLYNAMPEAGVDALILFMQEFEKR